MQDQFTPPIPENDSIEQLRADILASDPAAVRKAVDDRAEEFLRGCVRFAKTMQLNDDPWLGIRCLIEATLWIKEAQSRLDREVAGRRKPTRTIDAFKE